jgi:hypothetical protein
MAEDKKENEEGKNPSGVLESIGDLQDYVKSGATKDAAMHLGQAAKDIIKKKEEGKD